NLDYATHDGEYYVYSAESLENKYVITASSNEYGVISPSGKNYFDEGESPIFTFAANTGHYVKRIVVDGEQLSEETLASAIENGYRFSAIDADHTIEVEFAATEYTITYKDANGDLLTDLQPTMYTYGVGATLPENIEKEGYVFGGWYASADYSGNPTTNISVSESGDKTYYAKFDEEITYTVTIEETEYGTVEPSGALTVQSGDDLELTFKPDDGYILSELVIDGEDVTHLVVDNKYTIENITKDYRVRAVFDKPMYTITATYDSNGTIEVNEGGTNSPAEEHYVYGGESLIFTFLPNVGCYVKSIVVDGEELTGTEFENALANGYTFANIDGNHTISAVFEKYTYSITVIQTEHGVISPDSIAAIAYGENQTFTITPELGYLIERVIVDGVDLSSGEIEDAATNGYTFANIDENHTISATFKEDLTTPYTVKHWQESLTAEGATLIEDKYYTLVATDASQKGMAGQLTSAAANDYEGFTAQTINQQTIASDGSSVVDVLYNRNTYLLTLATTDGIASVSGAGEYLFGQTVSVSAIIEDEYNWTAWVSSDASKLADGESLEYSFTMPAAPITLTATAALKQYTITFEDIIDGSVIVDGDTITDEKLVNHGADLELTFVPYEGLLLRELLIDGEDVTHLVVDNKFTLTNITDDYRLSVIFNLPTYEITAQSNGLGTIDPEGLTTVFEGDEVGYTFTPDVGCKIKDVKVNGVSVGAVDSYTFTEIDSDCTIYVEFEKIKLSINVIAGDHGIVTPNGETIVEYGSDATFTIFAEANYGIEYIKVNGQYIDIKEMFTLRNITENTTIEIEFMKMYFTITATSGANGSITPSAAVKLGQQKRFDFIPNEGYKVKDVKVDNVSIGAVGQYTFVNVDSDHTISVEFEIQTFNVTVTSDGKGSLNTEQSLENVAYGENITFTISIAEEWELYKLYVNGESVDVENNILTIRVDKDTTIQAIFKEKTAEMNTIMIILIAAAAVVVIALATVLIVYHKKSKNRRKDGTPPDATTGGGEQGVKTIKTAHSAQPHPQAPKMPQEMDMSDTKLQMQQEEVVPGVQESQVEDQMLSQALQFAKGRQDHFIAFCARNKLDYQKDYNGAVKRYYQAYLRSRNKTKPPQG
ncbi:MAG: InlB B-repeat-containing protein, partial [Clostridia bacterium]|nr:InlB B-repeat-containing protein [Clostridia bacterium]